VHRKDDTLRDGRKRRRIGGAMDQANGSLVPDPFGPLEGVRILSTGTLIAEPFAAHLAGAFGAEVIQVEHPSGTCDPYDMIGQAFGGLAYQTGFPDPEPPVRAAPYTGDYITALFALWSTLAAYIHVQRTGEGQVVDLAQYEAVHQILAGTMVQYFQTGTVRERSGNKAAHFQPYDVFAASDGWVCMGAAGPMFARTCELIGLDPDKYACAFSELTSPEGVHFDLRLRQWIGERTVAEVVEQLNAISVPSCPVMSSQAMAKDPHYEARGVHIEWEDLQVGKVKGTGVAPKFSRTPGKIWRGSVPLGHDNELIYRDLLGLSAAELADLRQRQIV
jgi:crotonobetainyl-CoA:carnitine CoA-transferase CaiB-like acyl-CoA transferase